MVEVLLQIGVPNLLTEKPYAFFEILRCSRRNMWEKERFFFLFYKQKKNYVLDILTKTLMSI